MLWRVRATLADRPGALATLAQHCGARDVNILALQIFPGVDGVTDELVLRAPEGWTLSDVAALVEAAGAAEVSVGACTEQALVDGPTRYLTAVRQVLHGAERPAAVLARLLDGLTDETGAAARLTAVQDTLVVGSASDRVEVRRTTPFTPTEHARATAFVETVAELRERGLVGEVAPAAPATFVDGPVQVRPATLGDVAGLRAMHDRCSAETVLRHYAAPMARLDPRLARRMLAGGAGGLVATVGDRVVGIAVLAEVGDTGCDASLLVEDGWQRRGIGTRLLGAAARRAAGQGADHLVLRGPADSPAAVAMVFGSGLRARVRLSGDELLVTVSTRGLLPLAAAPTAARPSAPSRAVPTPAAAPAAAPA
jgi:GNAT superfamily N-acetyltransferase